MDFFSNPALIGIVGTLTFVVTCFLAYPTIVSWWRSKKHKKWIVLKEISFVKLVHKDIESFCNVRVTYNDKEEQDHWRNLRNMTKLAKLKMKLVNVGEQDVLKEDFQSDFNLRLGGLEWLEVRGKQSNEASNAGLKKSEDRRIVNISFDILKRDDFIEIEALIAANHGDIDDPFHSLKIHHGLKDTFVEKRREKLKNLISEFDLFGYAALSFIVWMFCTSIVATSYSSNKSKENVLEQQVLFLSPDGSRYSANYADNNLVLLENTETQDSDISQNVVLFQNEFEQHYKPVLDSTTQTNLHKQKEYSIGNYIFMGITFLVFFTAYIISAFVFLISVLGILVNFLKRMLLSRP